MYNPLMYYDRYLPNKPISTNCMPNSIIITKTIAMVEPKTILQLLIFKIASTIANNTPHKHNIIPNSNEKLGIKSVYKIIFFIATENNEEKLCFDLPLFLFSST